MFIYILECGIKIINFMLLLLSLKGKVSATDEFLKADIILKTIRINSMGRIIEEK